MTALPVQKSFVVVRDHGPSLDRLHGAVLAIGNFDGVHLGHRAVLRTAMERAHAAGKPAAALTFEPHPRRYFQPDAPSFRLSSEAAKLRLLAATGLDGAVVLSFNKDLADLTAPRFVEEFLLSRIGVSGVVVGFNFQFGKGRQGTIDFLKTEGSRRGFSVDVVEPFELNGERVSSGAVREALAAGDINRATALLGQPWFVTAQVVHGDKRGRELGFPTANLRLGPECGLRHGIYAVRASVGGTLYEGVASFGRRPMFDNGAVLLEVFLFDFKGDLYGTVMDVALIGWIRPEMTFDSVDDLVRRMDDDVRRAKTMLGRHPGEFPTLGHIEA